MQEHAMLLKLFYQKDEYVTEVLRKFLSVKRPFTNKILKNKITKFEAAVSLAIVLGAGRNGV